jgi:hypothetical protein
MKDLKTICNINIPNSLHSLLEGILGDIDSTLDKADYYANADLLTALNAKSEEEFNEICKILIKRIDAETKSRVQHGNKLVKGKSYIFICEEDGHYTIFFVDKYPAYLDIPYAIMWPTWYTRKHEAILQLDDRTFFEDIADSIFGKTDGMTEYCETPKSLVKSMKTAVKICMEG